MSKEFYLISFVSLVVIGDASTYFEISHDEESSITLERVEALAHDESGDPDCYNGGRGASQCSIDAGIDLGAAGVSANCSVTCDAGYYACCHFRCTCVQIN